MPIQLARNSLEVLKSRYLEKNDKGEVVETPEELFRRVAKAVAAAEPTVSQREEAEDVFYNMLTSLDFLPNSPTLMNAGKPLGQLSACFVLPVGDSMDEIFESIKNTALIHKSGGGTGFSFSRLRPVGSYVHSTGGTSSGPVSFMKVFDAATESVKQGGKRRGANMGLMRVDHPDIVEFIKCKNDLHTLNNFNISVALTDAFMYAVKNDSTYDLVDPSTKKVVGTLQAREIFDMIIDSAWRTGEPGILFIDRVNKYNPFKEKYGDIEATNPCGEQPLLPYEACNLGSINLRNMYDPETHNVDWAKLKRVVRNAVHFLDNVIDVNKYPISKIDEMTRATRKIGLGVMGFADLLLLMDIPYDSEEAISLAEAIMGTINEVGHDTSNMIGAVRGAYPAYEYRSIDTPTRNATVTTIAPTGTLSIIANCSSGVEPIFAYAYYRNVVDTKLTEANDILIKRLKEAGIYSDDLMAKIIEQGTLAHIDEVPTEIRKVFVCSHDIAPEWHIRMQAAFQRYTDNAVSKTVNFKNSATKDDVRKAYELAYELGCKGTTIYRDGSRENQTLQVGKAEATVQSVDTLETPPIVPRERPTQVSGFTRKVPIGCGNLYITINHDDKGICEVFTNTGRAGGCAAQSEATARLASVMLRSGVEIQEVIRQLRGIRCPSCQRRSDVKVMSCPDAIGRTLAEAYEYLKTEQPVSVMAESPDAVSSSDLKYATKCPECGSPLEHDGGCPKCRNCGWSKCG